MKRFVTVQIDTLDEDHCSKNCLWFRITQGGYCKLFKEKLDFRRSKYNPTHKIYSRCMECSMSEIDHQVND